MLYNVVKPADVDWRGVDNSVVTWYDADRDVLIVTQYLMVTSQNVPEVMKTIHARLSVTTITNSREYPKFIVKEESGQTKMDNPLHRTVKV